MAYAGLDVGTSGCKIVVYGVEGNVIFQAAETYREYGEDGYREIDPDEVRAKVLKVLKRVGEDCPEKIAALAVASLGESIICMDKDGKSLGRSMVTGDKRGGEECQELIREKGSEWIMEITGLPASEMYGLPKYIWMNRNTDAIKKAVHIFFYEDYVGYLLTGKRMVSDSSASRSMAFDIHKKEWNEELLGLAGIRPEQMSRPGRAGTVIGLITEEMAEELHLSAEMKVVVGGHDQSCAAFGSGLNDPKVGECGMGTCEFMFLILPDMGDPRYMIDHDFTCVPYVLGNQYLTSLEVTTCGILKNWCRDTVLAKIAAECEARGENFFAHMDSRISGLTTELLVLPQFGSSGNPDINCNVSGTITGLTIHTKPEEIYLAVLEGMAFQMKLSYDLVKKLGVDIRKMICTGGGARSDLTLQMRADIFGMEVVTVQSEETGTLGCMALSAVGDGAYGSMEEAVRRIVRIAKVFTPDTSKTEYYKRKYEKFKRLYETMHLF
ncbi:MAG: hypothetical protein HFI67_08255 [Lachnospiraceae bacterium]|nr:hypothetical protein [Lachnospiraceae bacterium]